ncbi:hypothetical protein AVEN_27894-1 [Araneus ventricosus]|uniref:Uncharacterized protein n=1 Tax=Araneus ventricosus TaxID=182803 RepID=A0A4Y2SEF7_ARAVE|nr:hypothetical protein AVEN_27894-1 [Araneus ventricosus]
MFDGLGRYPVGEANRYASDRRSVKLVRYWDDIFKPLCQFVLMQLALISILRTITIAHIGLTGERISGKLGHLAYKPDNPIEHV